MLIKKKSARKRCRRFLKITAVCLLLTALFFELRLKPVTEAVAVTQAQAMATELMSASVSEVLTEWNVTSEQLETVTYGKSNAVTSIQSDAVLNNRLKEEITLRIQQKLSGINNHRIDVPLGTMIGGELLSGLGPSFPVFISLSGNVRTDFESSFEQGGMNQTVHKLSLHILAQVDIIMPSDTVCATAETSVLLGETVIVGEVPSGMLMHSAYQE